MFSIQKSSVRSLDLQILLIISASLIYGCTGTLIRDIHVCEEAGLDWEVGVGCVLPEEGEEKQPQDGEPLVGPRPSE